MTEEIERREAEEEESGEESGQEPVQVEEEQDAMEDVSSEVSDLRDELDALNDRHLRLAAEFDNYRKRNERDRRDMASRLRADLVASLLDVLDDLERVSDSDAASVTQDALLDGVRLVEKKFRGALESVGLERVDAEGQVFDPEVMEALMMVPTADAEQDGRVADVFQTGYRLGNTLVRPARVRVHEYDESAGDE